jgi:hypothetical protein
VDEALRPAAPDPVHDRLGPEDVRAHEIHRPDGRAVDVRFGGEVEHRAEAPGRDAIVERRVAAEVADVPLDEPVPGVARDVVEVPPAARVGDEVEVPDLGVRVPGQEEADEVAPDEAAAPGDEEPAAHAALPVERR